MFDKSPKSFSTNTSMDPRPRDLVLQNHIDCKAGTAAERQIYWPEIGIVFFRTSGP